MPNRALPKASQKSSFKAILKRIAFIERFRRKFPASAIGYTQRPFANKGLAFAAGYSTYNQHIDSILQLFQAECTKYYII